MRKSDMLRATTTTLVERHTLVERRCDEYDRAGKWAKANAWEGDLYDVEALLARRAEDGDAEAAAWLTQRTTDVV